jgi:hypothetical protein
MILSHVCAAKYVEGESESGLKSGLEANKDETRFADLKHLRNKDNKCTFVPRFSPARVIRIKVSRDLPLHDACVRPYLWAQRPDANTDAGKDGNNEPLVIESLVIPTMHTTSSGSKRVWFKRVPIPEAMIDYTIWTKTSALPAPAGSVLTHWGAQTLKVAMVFDRYTHTLAFSGTQQLASKLKAALTSCLATAEMAKHLFYDEVEEWEARHPDSYIANMVLSQPFTQLGAVCVRDNLSLSLYEAMWNSPNSKEIVQACRLELPEPAAHLAEFGYLVGNNLGGNTFAMLRNFFQLMIANEEKEKQRKEALRKSSSSRNVRASGDLESGDVDGTGTLDHGEEGGRGSEGAQRPGWMRTVLSRGSMRNLRRTSSRGHSANGLGQTEEGEGNGEIEESVIHSEWDTKQIAAVVDGHAPNFEGMFNRNKEEDDEEEDDEEEVEEGSKKKKKRKDKKAKPARGRVISAAKHPMKEQQRAISRRWNNIGEMQEEPKDEASTPKELLPPKSVSGSGGGDKGDGDGGDGGGETKGPTRAQRMKEYQRQKMQKLNDLKRQKMQKLDDLKKSQRSKAQKKKRLAALQQVQSTEKVLLGGGTYTELWLQSRENKQLGDDKAAGYLDAVMGRILAGGHFSATKHHHATEQLTKTDLQHYYAKHEPAKAREVLGDVVGAWETKTLAKQLEKQFGESPLAFAMERSADFVVEVQASRTGVTQYSVNDTYYKQATLALERATLALVGDTYYKNDKSASTASSSHSSTATLIQATGANQNQVHALADVIADTSYANVLHIIRLAQAGVETTNVKVMLKQRGRSGNQLPAVSTMLNVWPISGSRKQKIGFRFSIPFRCNTLVRRLQADNVLIDALGKELTKRQNIYRVRTVNADGKVSEVGEREVTRDMLSRIEGEAGDESMVQQSRTLCCLKQRLPVVSTVDSDDWLVEGAQVHMQEEGSKNHTVLGKIAEIRIGGQYRMDDWERRGSTIHKDGDFTDVVPLVARMFIIVMFTIFLISPAATVVGILLGGEQTGMLWDILTFGVHGHLTFNLALPRFDLAFNLAFKAFLPELDFAFPNLPLICNSITLALDVLEIFYKFLRGESPDAQDVIESKKHMLQLGKEDFNELVSERVTETASENELPAGDPGGSAQHLRSSFGSPASTTMQPGPLEYDVLLGEVPTRIVKPGFLAIRNEALRTKIDSFLGQKSSLKNMKEGQDQSQDIIRDAAFPHQNSFSNPGFQMNVNPMAAEISAAAASGPKEATAVL